MSAFLGFSQHLSGLWIEEILSCLACCWWQHPHHQCLCARIFLCFHALRPCMYSMVKINQKNFENFNFQHFHCWHCHQQQQGQSTIPDHCKSVTNMSFGHWDVPKTLAVSNSATSCGAKMQGLRCEQMCQLWIDLLNLTIRSSAFLALVAH